MPSCRKGLKLILEEVDNSLGKPGYRTLDIELIIIFMTTPVVLFSMDMTDYQ
jgi:hypothetical protein